MNTYKYIIGLLLLSLVVSCSSDIEDVNLDLNKEEMVGEKTVSMNFNCSKADFDVDLKPSTRATASGEWENGDIVYLLFSCDNGSVPGKAVYNSSTKGWTVTYEGTLTRDKELKLQAYYFDGEAVETDGVVTLQPTTGVYRDLGGSYVYPTGDEINAVAHLVPASGRIMLKGPVKEAILMGGVTYYVSYDINQGDALMSNEPLRLLTNDDGLSNYHYAVIDKSDNSSFYVKNGYFSFEPEVKDKILQIGKSGWMSVPSYEKHNGWRMSIIKQVELGTKNISVSLKSTQALSAKIEPYDLVSDQSVGWKSLDEDIATVKSGLVTPQQEGMARIVAYSQGDQDITDTCLVKIIDSKEHPFVDLGLPSGTLWATYNVGAFKIDDYGKYYSWGETSTKYDYSWGNHKYMNAPSELPTSADAAYVNWGSTWRMPTVTQFRELVNQCVPTGTTSINDVTGLELVGPNGNCIFFPAAGDMWQTTRQGYTVECWYYTSSLHTVNPGDNQRQIYYFTAYPKSLTYRIDDQYGYYGGSVRAVWNKY